MSFPLRLVLAGLLLAPGAVFGEKPRFGDTVSAALGGMFHRGEFTVASTRQGVPIDELTFRELGMDDKAEVLWGDLTWQFAERWQASFTYTSYDADGFVEARTGGNFGDLEWEVGTELTSSFDMKLYIVDVTWDFLKTEKAHMGAGIGLHAADLDMDMRLSGGVEISPGNFLSELRAEEASVLAPLPNLSVVGGMMLNDKLYLGGHAGYFSLSYDKYDGELISLRAALEWRPWRRLGLGLAYQYVDIDLEVDGSSTTELYDLKFYGPVLFLSTGF